MQRYRVVIMLVLFGVLPVVAAFFVALSFLGEQEVEPTQAEVKPVTEEAPPPPEPPQTRQVFAAARAMPAGTLIGEDDLITLELDPDAVRKEHIIVPGEQASHPLRGHVVREGASRGSAANPVGRRRAGPQRIPRGGAEARCPRGDNPGRTGDESRGAHRPG